MNSLLHNAMAFAARSQLLSLLNRGKVAGSTGGGALLALAVLAAAGCSTTHYKESADRESYALIQEKAPDVPNMDPEFTIDTAPRGLDGLPETPSVDEALGEMGAAELGAKVVSLEQALELAVKNNRTYQTRKEGVYLAALDLSLSRHQFTPIWNAGATAAYARSTTDRFKLTPEARFAQIAPDLVQEVGQLVGTPADLLNAYTQIVEGAINATGADQPSLEIMNERSVDGQTRVGVDLLLKGGAQIAISLTSNFLRFLTGDPRVDTSSALIGSIRQPLLRGAGTKVTTEFLIQSERDLLYEIRDFTQFRKEFAVDIASAYYRVLQARDEVRNNYRGYQALTRGAERMRALAQAQRATISDVGRSEQAALSAEDSWVASVRNYREQLDRFKIELGLPTDTNLILDDKELEALRARGIIHPAIASEDAVTVGIASRLDLYIAEDQVLDAERRVDVAANALKADLDILVDARVPSMPGDRFQELDFQRAVWSAGIDVDLPLDRKQERNSYRSALISYERSKRNRDLAVDNVKLEVRQTWRDLEQARRSFEIREIGAKLNESRVEEQELRAQAGTATALDQIDAQNDLIDAQNALTDALVSHTIARLEFWRAMGILYIKENGQWEEVTDVDSANG